MKLELEEDNLWTGRVINYRRDHVGLWRTLYI